MKRLIEFCLRATDNIQVEIPQILESQKYYFTMKKSFQKLLEQFLPGRQRKGRATDNIQVEIPQILESQKYYFTMKKSFQKLLEQFLPGRQRKGNKDETAYHITQEQLSCIIHKAMDYPIEMTLRLLRERLPWSPFDYPMKDLICYVFQRNLPNKDPCLF